MQSSGEGEWLHRRFHSAVQGCFAAGLPDVAPQATFTSLRAEHWTRLGDVTPEDAYTLHLNRRSATSISLCGRYGVASDTTSRSAAQHFSTSLICQWWRSKGAMTCCGFTSRGAG